MKRFMFGTNLIMALVACAAIFTLLILKEYREAWISVIPFVYTWCNLLAIGGDEIK